MATNNVIPVAVSDTLLHEKNTDLTEKVILPFTRYANVMNAPKVTTSPTFAPGAPFLFYQTKTSEYTELELREMLPGLF